MKLENVLISLAVVTVSAGVLFFLRFLLFKYLHHWAKKSKTTLDNLIINVVKVPSIFWCIGLALYVGIESSDFPSKYTFYIIKVIHVLIIISVTVVLANIVNRLFSKFFERSNVSVQSTGLLNTLLRGAVYLIGLIIILNIFGISIAPLITALGIGGLAVALALKDTLENLFAGVNIMAEKSIRVGDFVRLENGQEGYVEDISWRTTRIRMLSNNLIIIPNSKLSQNILVNYTLPDGKMWLSIPVRVSYYSDPDKVEKILLEEARKASQEIPGVLSEPEPRVRFVPGFGESSLDFTILCFIQDVTYQFPVQHQLRKRIFSRFQQEGIEIPFSQRVV